MMLARPAVLARLMTPRRYLDRAYLERVAGDLYGGSARTDWAIIPLANARLMHRLIRDSRLHVYPGGHLGLLTEAAGLAPVVDGFLAGP